MDACFLYKRLAEVESDSTVANVFRQMSDIEMGHAEAFLKKQGTAAPLPPPSFRARVLDRIGKIFGYDYVLGALMDTEKSISNALMQAKNKSGAALTGSETNHVKILRSLLYREAKVTGTNVARFESRHRSVGGNALRAAVLGGNDGLVSNFSLVMGIAGATAGQSGVLLAGIAGLLAGALSWPWANGYLLKAHRNCMKTRCSSKWKSWKPIPKANKKNWRLFIWPKAYPSNNPTKWPQTSCAIKHMRMNSW